MLLSIFYKGIVRVLTGTGVDAVPLQAFVTFTRLKHSPAIIPSVTVGIRVAQQVLLATTS